MLIPRSEHPKMQFYRPDWVNLNGEWSYEFDFGKSGIERGLQKSAGFAGKIIVPFCPESPLSGVGHTDFIESMFYQRALEIPAAWDGRRILLHFGAVDYTAVIYLDGVEIGRHSGGSISFTVDLTRHVEAGKSYNLVVHVLDDQRSFAQPFGKQSPMQLHPRDRHLADRLARSRRNAGVEEMPDRAGIRPGGVRLPAGVF